VLYRLPELMESHDSAPLLLVEGEKDVDAAITAGFVATTTPGGAGKAHLCDLTPLRGRHVILCPDQDPAGFMHADDLARRLLPIAASVRRYDVPGAGDFKDMSEALESGLTGADLRQDMEQKARLVEVASVGQSGPHSPPAGTPSEVMALAPEEPDYVIKGVLVKGAVTEFDGRFMGRPLMAYMIRAVVRENADPRLRHEAHAIRGPDGGRVEPSRSGW
jgi:hypothetical protein